MDIGELLAFGVKNGASDMHLSAGMPPMIRVDGDMRKIDVPPMDNTTVRDRDLITGASPLASNELGKLAASTLLKEL